MTRASGTKMIRAAVVSASAMSIPSIKGQRRVED